MSIDQFLGRLETDNAGKRGTHKLGKPLADAELDRWQKKHPGIVLPETYLALLRRANGLTIHPTRYTPLGDITLLPLKKVDFAPRVMSEEGDGSDDELYPPTWQSIAMSGNKDWIIALDTATGQYLLLGIYSNKPEIEMETLDHFLTWIDNEFLDREGPEPEKPKGKKAQKAAGSVMNEVARFLHPGEQIESIAVSPDGNLVFTGVQYSAASPENPKGQTLRLWDRAAGRIVRYFGEEEGFWTNRVAFSADGRTLASSHPEFVCFWNAATGDCLHRIACPHVDGLALSPDGRLALGSAREEIVYLWKVPKGREVRQYPGHAGFGPAVAFSPDGKRFVSVGWDKIIRVRDLESGDEIGPFPKQDFSLLCVAYSPDGKHLATAGKNRTVRLWDVDSQKVVRELTGHRKGSVLCVGFSPDGSRLVSGGEDEHVRLWDVHSGSEIARFTGFVRQGWCGAYKVTCVSFTPDGRYVLCSNVDSTVRVLEIPSGK